MVDGSRSGIAYEKLYLKHHSNRFQTYQWITQYPNFVDLAVPFCGSARTALHNQVFLEGEKSALLAAKGLSSASSGGLALHALTLKEGDQIREWTEQEKSVGLKAFGRGYAGW